MGGGQLPKHISLPLIDYTDSLPGVDQRYNLSFIVENGVTIDRPIIGVSINYRLRSVILIMHNLHHNMAIVLGASLPRSKSPEVATRTWVSETNV